MTNILTLRSMFVLRKSNEAFGNKEATMKTTELKPVIKAASKMSGVNYSEHYFANEQIKVSCEPHKVDSIKNKVLNLHPDLRFDKSYETPVSTVLRFYYN